MPAGRLWPYAAVLVAAAGFGTYGIFSRVFYDHGGEPFTLLALRFAVLALAFALFALARGARLPRPRLAAAAVALGAAQLGTGYALLEGFARAPVGLVVLLFYLYPLLVAVGAAALFREELGLRRVLLLVCGLTGIALTVSVPSAGSGVGVALGLAAGAGATVVVLGGRHLMVSHELSPAMFSALVFVGPGLAVAALLAVGRVELGLEPAAWSAAAGAVFVSGLLPILLFFGAVKRIGAGTASLLATPEPLVAVVLAYALLGERLTALQLAGGALILAAVVAVSVSAAGGGQTPRRDGDGTVANA